MATSTDVTTLSVLERRHIIETVQLAIFELQSSNDNYGTSMCSVEDLQEILRILGADSVEEE